MKLRSTRVKECKSKRVLGRLLYSFTFVLLYFFTSPAYGAVAYDNSATQDGDGVGSITLVNFAVAATNPLVLCSVAQRGGSADISGVTYNSVAMTQVGSSIIQYTDYILSLWRLTGQSGTHNAVATYSGTPTHGVLACMSFTGVDQASPVGTPQTTTDYVTGVSITVPANGLGADFASAMQATLGCAKLVGTAGAGQTERFDGCSDRGATQSIEIAGSTRSATGSFTWIETGGGAVEFQVGAPISAAPATVVLKRRPKMLQ